MLAAFGFKAHAGGEGGGGSVVQCIRGLGPYAFHNNTLMDMYDFWNASGQEYNFTISRPGLLNHINLIRIHEYPYMDQIKARLETLKELDEGFAKYIWRAVQKFSPENIGKGDVHFVSQLADDGDGRHIVLPDNQLFGKSCIETKVYRIAQFKLKPKKHEYPFLVVKPLWDKAPNFVKAAVAQHEVIYQFAKSNFGDSSSRNAQYFNALISSEEFKEYTKDEYGDSLAELGWNFH